MMIMIIIFTITIVMMIMILIFREPPAALRRHAMKTVQDYLATAPHLFQVIVIVMMMMTTIMTKMAMTMIMMVMMVRTEDGVMPTWQLLLTSDSFGDF